MIYIVIINIIVVLAMLTMFLKSTSKFKKIANNTGNVEIEGEAARKYMKISIMLAPISLVLKTFIIIKILL